MTMFAKIASLVALVSGLVGCSAEKSNPIVDGGADVEYLGVLISTDSGPLIDGKVKIKTGESRVLRFQAKTYPDTSFMKFTQGDSSWSDRVNWTWQFWKFISVDSANPGSITGSGLPDSKWEDIDSLKFVGVIEGDDEIAVEFGCRDHDGMWRVNVTADDQQDSLGLPGQYQKGNAFGVPFQIMCQ